MQNETVLPNPKSKKLEWLLWLILLIPFFYILFIWNKLPESIPIHWNFKGEPDNYSSKLFGVLFMPLLNIGLYILLLVTPKIDPRKNNYNYFGHSYRNIRFAIALFFTSLFIVTMQLSLGSDLFDFKAVFLLVFGLLAVIGNFMRTLRSNFFIGIRTPWTLEHPEVWKKTHEKSGKLWFYASLAAMGISFFLPKEFILWLLIPYLSVLVIYPILLSYLLYRKTSAVNPNQ